MAAAEHVAAAQVLQDLGIDPYKSYEEAVHATEPDRVSGISRGDARCHAPCELEEKIWHRGVKVWRCEVQFPDLRKSPGPRLASRPEISGDRKNQRPAPGLIQSPMGGLSNGCNDSRDWSWLDHRTCCCWRFPDVGDLGFVTNINGPQEAVQLLETTHMLSTQKNSSPACRTVVDSITVEANYAGRPCDAQRVDRRALLRAQSSGLPDPHHACRATNATSRELWQVWVERSTAASRWTACRSCPSPSS